MKIRLITLSLVCILLSLFASVVCADDLQDVMSRQSLNFGTSADYFPFVYSDEAHELTGLDIAIIEEIGKRMGVAVKIIDIAFDGLIDALSIGQVDLIGGGLSKTADRAQIVDFSTAYYTGNGILIANATSAYENVQKEQLNGKKIGVQKGSSFEQYLKTELQPAGLIQLSDILLYAKDGDEMSALQNGQVDFVILDQDVYEKEYAVSNTFKVANATMHAESYAFAAAKNSTLINVINQHLADILKDGTAQTIANQFFSMTYHKADENPIVKPQPAPAPAPVPSNCVNAMSFVADVSIPDGTAMNPGQAFTKTWRIYNNGSCAWSSSYSLVYVSGDNFGASIVNIAGNVAPGQTYDISAPMSAPKNGGTYVSNWQMRDAYGKFFGQTVYVKIKVPGQPGPNPNPNPKPPVPAPNPTPNDPVYIQGFYSDTDNLDPGGCATVYFDVANATSSVILLDGTQVYSFTTGSGSTGVCLYDGSGLYHTVKIIAKNPSFNASEELYISLNQSLPTTDDEAESVSE